MSEPEIFALTAEDGPALSALLERQTPGYVEHFHPFPFDERSVTAALAEARQDRFWGIRVDRSFAGFFMLRGFDRGYLRPSFGVLVSEQFAGRGLARLALAHSAKWCTDNGVERVMLKVAPENQRAWRTYVAAGFEHVEDCPATGHAILELALNDRKT
jgi:RimJ/RimL family protein N-acetyltransferase